MTLSWYPDELPRPRRDGYSRTLADGRQATKNESGPPRVRRRFSSAAAAMQMVVDLTVDQRMRFFRFWEEDTVLGSKPFWMPDWTVAGIELGTEAGDVITDETGRPLVIEAVLLCMFGTEQPPAETVLGVDFRVSFQLAILP